MDLETNYCTCNKNKKVFPLQSITSLAKRWGVTQQVVKNWSVRHEDFPDPAKGLIEEVGRTPSYYPLYEIEHYEENRRLRLERGEF